MAHIVVVGGGITGMASALLLRSWGHEVYLVEKSKRLGGLFDSFLSDVGAWFDYGFHAPGDTGISEFDKLLYNTMDEDSWYHLNYFKGGSYFNGTFNEKSNGIDIRTLPQPELDLAESQLLAREGEQESYSSLYHRFLDRFGEHLTDKVFEPISQKMTGVRLKDLAHTASLPFGTQITCFTPEKTKELKERAELTEILSEHSYETKHSELKYYYPRQGGIVQWIDALKASLDSSGVITLLEDSIENLTIQDGTIETMTLKSGKKLACDHLVWTIPLFPLAKEVGIDLSTLSGPPILRRDAMHHFAFSKNTILTDVASIVCADPDLCAASICIYSNIQLDSEHDNLTVEVFVDKEPDLEAQKLKVLDELCTIGVIPHSASTTYSYSHMSSAIFPLATNESEKDKEFQEKEISKKISNICFVGRAFTGAAHKSFSVLRHAYSVLHENFSS